MQTQNELGTEIDAIQSQNEVAILCGCAECGRRVTDCSPGHNEQVFYTPRPGVVFIKRDPEAVFSLGFALCGECCDRLMEIRPLATP